MGDFHRRRGVLPSKHTSKGALRVDESSSTYEVEYASRRRVLMIRVGATLTDEIYMHQYRAAQRCIASLGPSSFILDLSPVKFFELSYPFLVEIGEMPPAIPPQEARYVVAPQDHVYGAVRIVETLRSIGPAPIRPVHKIEDAFASLGVTRSDFEALEAA